MELDFRRAEAGLGAVLAVTQRAALVAIVVGRPIWVQVARLGVAHRGEVEGLVAVGVVALWEVDALGVTLADGPFVTLTAWGAWLLNVEPDEEVDEYPRWAERVDPGSPIPRPIRMPRAAGSYGMTLPELVVDPTPPPSHLLDPESGQVVELFAGGGCRGVPVEIDRRLGKGERGRGKERKKGKGRKRVA